MSKKEDKSVAKVKNSLPVVPEGIDFDADAGVGSESMTVDDLAIPRINIIQSLSPQRSKTKSEYIEGAEEGMIFDSVSKKLIDGEKGILIVPIQFTKLFLEWAPRETGKGLVANHGGDRAAYDAATVNLKYQHITNAGNEVIPTAEYFVFLIDEETGSARPYVLSMSKSGMKHAKRWNSIINTLLDTHPTKPEINNWDAPIFWGTYRLTAVPESNQQGEWYRWEIKQEGTIKDLENCWDIYTAANKFREGIADGKVKAQEPDVEHVGEGSSEGDDDPM